MGLFSKMPDEEQQLVNAISDEFSALKAADSERIARMEQYRKEIESTRAKAPMERLGTDYGRDRAPSGDVQRHRFSFPFAQALTVKHSFRIAGRLPDAQVDRREETPDERHRSDVMERMWWGTVRESNGDVKLGAVAHDASQLGAGAMEVYWDAKRQMPLFRDIDPTGLLVVRGVENPHDFERAYRFWEVPYASLVAQYRGKFVDEAGQRPVDFNGFDVAGDGRVIVVQMADRDQIVRFAVSATGKPGEKPIGLPLFRRSHGYGFVNYVVVPNLGPERNVWGWADYDFVREIVAYIPTLFGREADILRMVANGAMKARGTKLTPAAVQKILRAGGVVPVGKDGDIDPVQAPDVPQFASEHSAQAIQFLQMLGFAPAAAWGDGNAGSGSDRGLQLGPMLELTMMKQLNFGSALSRLGAMCFQMAERLQAGNATYRGGVQRRGVTRPFSVTVGPQAAPKVMQNRLGDPLELTMDPRELIGGDHKIRFSWPSRLDPDDPAFVASELNKFAQGAQSLRTTLERFGFEAPEDELKLIEQENEDHPWLRQGMLKLIELQMGASQQGQNDGSQNQGADFGGAVDTMTSKDGQALDGDAMSGQLSGGPGGQLFGGA